MAKRIHKLTGELFDKLPDSEKERIFRQLDNLTPEQADKEFRPMTAAQKREHYKPRKIGRPKLGRSGTEIISVTVEKALLKRANAYAKSKGMKRSELVSMGLKMAIEAGVSRKAG